MSFSFSSPHPQPSASWLPPWPFPPLLSWLSEPHALHDGLPLPLVVKGGTSAPPRASAVSLATAFLGPQRHFVKCRRGWGKT